MTESKVYLAFTSVEMTNNQNQFITNQQLEHIKEQKEANLYLMDALSALNKSCQTILDSIHKKEAANNLYKKKQSLNYMYLKNNLLDIVQDVQGFQTHFNDQERSFQTIKDYLVKQDDVNRQLLNTIRRHNSSIQNLGLTQKNHFNNIANYLEDQDIQQKKAIGSQQIAAQQVLESITGQGILLQNKFEKQDHFYETMSNRMEKSEEYSKVSIDRQDTLERMSQEMITKIERQDAQQGESIHEMKDLLKKLLQAKGSISKLLTSLPPNYSIKQVVVNGVTIPLTNFLLINEKTGVAVFTNGSETMYIAIDKIDALYWT